MNRKSSWRPISAGTASLRSSTKPGAAAAAKDEVTGEGIVWSSEWFGADQLLRQQHGHRLAALEHHGQRRRSRGDHVLRPLGPQTNNAHGRQYGLRCLAHGKLPRVALAEVAAHAHQCQERKARALDEREHVDAVADPAR